MASYSKPLPPRPANAARSKPLVSADFMAKQMGGQVPANAAQPQPPQVQGRSVVNQGGQQGVMGAGGNFQPLGAAALSRLSEQEQPTPGISGVSKAWQPPANNGFLEKMAGFGPNVQSQAGTGPDPTNAGIEGAIGSLKQQLGMAPGSMPDADMATRPLAGLRADVTKQPYFNGDELQTYSRGIGGAPSSGPMPGPNPNGRRAPLNRGLNSAWAARQGGGVQPQQQQPNPYAEILRQRLAANGGAGMGLGGGQFAY